MDNAAKIHLSALETELVNNTEWIFTKQMIIEKVYNLLGQLHNRYEEMILSEKDFLPDELKKPGGKIARGENYNGLPYLILDYPATFSKEGVFAIRTMFWWGNFFSVSLHLSGPHLQSRKNVLSGIDFLRQHDFFICINEKEWQHDFNSSNFIPISAIDQNEIESVNEKDFFKIAKRIELVYWEEVPRFLEHTFAQIIHFVKISYPDGKIVL
ncbi:MAG: hypothetical protein ABI237_15940 [Ginsengibacter sp.]